MDTRDLANNRSRVYTRVNTLAEVVNDTSGSKMYQDAANDPVWVQYRGGLAESQHMAWVRENYAPWCELSDHYLIGEHVLRVKAE